MMNMSRIIKVIFSAVLVLSAVSCARSARIDGKLSDAPSSEVIMKMLDVNRYQVLDTVRTDAEGSFRYNVEIKKGQPEFVYVFYKDTKVASLLLEAGDRVEVVADTLGRWTVSGSEESEKLAKVEADYAAAYAALERLSDQVKAASATESVQLRAEFTKEYIRYYRECVRYIMSNSRSLTSVQVLFNSFGSDLPVFGQPTDGIHFSNVADSLELVYPESKYVKALRQEADKRVKYMELSSKMAVAEEVDFLDIELPDVNAQKRKLSDVHSKVTLVYFWRAQDAAQKMFNLDVLAPVYREYHSKGFEIYQVALDVDKGLWAKVIKEQGLPWVNVCDAHGRASKYALTYNISSLPYAFIIGADGLENTKITDEKSLRTVVSSLL